VAGGGLFSSRGEISSQSFAVAWKMDARVVATELGSDNSV
jgi:hypothetical protein